MATNHIRRGHAITYTNTGDATIESGTALMIESVFGVTLVDIAAGESGQVATCAVYSVPKVTGAITQGALLYWDANGNPVGGTAGTGALTTTQGNGVLAGVAWSAAAEADTHVDVQLNGC